MPLHAFISYSHVDEKHLERLHKHMAMLQRDGTIETWSDHRILPGGILRPRPAAPSGEEGPP